MRLAIIAFCATVLCAGGLPLPVAAADITGEAVVADGDSLRVGETRVRLWAVDAPETEQRCTRKGVPWACGQEAAKFLGSLVSRKELRCSPKSRDSTGRTVAQCFLPNGSDVAAEIVEKGWGLAFRQFGRDYVAAEQRAKANKLGLWSGEFEEPWAWSGPSR